MIKTIFIFLLFLFLLNIHENDYDSLTNVASDFIFPEMDSLQYMGRLTLEKNIKHIPENGAIRIENKNGYIQLYIKDELITSCKENEYFYSKRLNEDVFVNIFKFGSELFFYNSQNTNFLVIYLWSSFDPQEMEIYKYLHWYIIKVPEFDHTLEKENFIIFDSKSFKARSFGLLKRQQYSVPYDSTMAFTVSELKYDSIRKNIFLNLETQFIYDETPFDTTLNSSGYYEITKRTGKTFLRQKKFNESLPFLKDESTFQKPSEAYEKELLKYLGVTDAILDTILYHVFFSYSEKQ